MQNPSNVLRLRQIPQEKPPKKQQTIFDLILEANSGYGTIKIRTRPLASGKHSFFLDIFQNGKRERVGLGITISGKRGQLKEDKQKLKWVIKEKNRLQKELDEKKDYLETIEKRKANFTEFFKALVDARTTSIKPWKNCFNYLNTFTGGTENQIGQVTFNDINKDWCESFKDYLLSQEKLNQNSAHTYFARLKAAFKEAIKEGIIDSNPAQYIQIKKMEVERAFLTIDEIKLLKNTPCPKEDTKQGFLFACFTGLRISDIKQLTFDKIEGQYLRYRQKKTDGVERVKLAASALNIIEAQRVKYSNTGLVFRLSADTNTLTHLKKWALKAGINKNIGWHTGRHSFATMNLTMGNDLYTVSKLLGHKDIKVTQIYAKLIDKKKDDAIDKLPEI